jgi:hypothetical protein
MWHELSRGKKVGVVVAGVIALGAVGSVVSPAEDSEDVLAPTEVSTTVDGSDIAAPSTAAPATTAALATTAAPTTSITTTTTSTTTTTTAPQLAVIAEGVYIVGDEIQPGVYRYVGYFARLDDDLEIIDNDLVFGDGLGLMEVYATDTFVEVGGEAIAVAEFPAVDPLLAGYTDGTYLVGIDLEPGRYRLTPLEGETGYWARLGEGRDILDNDLGDGQLIAVIKSTDWALEISNGTLERIG